MRLFSDASVARFKALDLKDLLIASGLISSYASKIKFTIVRQGGGCKFPAEVNWLILSSVNHWSYFSVARALKGLFQLTSGACIYFVHLPRTIEASISFLHEAKILQYLQYDIQMSAIRDNDGEMRRCKELYSPKKESTQCSLKVWE